MREQVEVSPRALQFTLCGQRPSPPTKPTNRSGRKKGPLPERPVNLKTAIYWQMVSNGPVGVLLSLHSFLIGLPQ